MRKSEIAILKLLFSANSSLDSYTLYKRVRVSMAEFQGALLSLQKKQLVNVVDFRASLTTKGYEQALYIGSTKKNNSPKSWREVPCNMTAPRLDTNEFYIPSRFRLDPRNFKK